MMPWFGNRRIGIGSRLWVNLVVITPWFNKFPVASLLVKCENERTIADNDVLHDVFPDQWLMIGDKVYTGADQFVRLKSVRMNPRTQHERTTNETISSSDWKLLWTNDQSVWYHAKHLSILSFRFSLYVQLWLITTLWCTLSVRMIRYTIRIICVQRLMPPKNERIFKEGPISYQPTEYPIKK